MSLVLDCSMAIAWCIEDESTPETLAILRHVESFGAFVPSLWRFEVANTLLMATRRGRITERHRGVMIRFLNELTIETDIEADTMIWHATLDLAERYNLTAYDAAYLELAIRRNLPLATLDKALVTAAGAAAIALR